MRKVAVLSVVLLVLTGCATMGQATGMARQPTDDESAILLAFTAYYFHLSGPCSAEEDLAGTKPGEVGEAHTGEEEAQAEGPADRPGFVESILEAIGGMVAPAMAGLEDALAAAMTDEVRVQSVREHAALCTLFGLDSDAELDLWLMAHSLEIVYPPTHADAAKYKDSVNWMDLSWWKRLTPKDRKWVLKVRSRIDDEVERPEATLNIDLLCAPPGTLDNGPLNADKLDQAFKQQRTLHLVKSDYWTIVRGEATVATDDAGELAR